MDETKSPQEGSVSFSPRWSMRIGSRWSTDIVPRIDRVEKILLNQELGLSQEVTYSFMNILRAMFTDDMDACIMVLNDIEEMLYVCKKRKVEPMESSLMEILNKKYDYANDMRMKMNEINQGLQAIPEDKEVESFITDLSCDVLHESMNEHPNQDEDFLSTDIKELNERIVLTALDRSTKELNGLRETLMRMKMNMDQVIEDTLDVLGKDMERIYIVRAFIANKL